MAYLEPLSDQIVAKPRHKKHQGVIATLTDEPTQEADVMAVGPGFVCEKTGVVHPTAVKAGDVIMYPKGTGSLVTVNDEEVLIISERNIFGILRG